MHVFTAYLETFDTNQAQEMEHIQETQASIVALLEQSSRVINCPLSMYSDFLSYRWLLVKPTSF